MTADAKILPVYKVGTIKLAVDHKNPMEADVLVVDSQLLGFDLLIGIDTIKMLGEVNISKFGEAIFSKTYSYICITIKIELDFSTEFDGKTRLWSWLGDQPLNELINWMPAYPVSAQIRQEYQHELQTCLDNGWLLSYSEKKFGPPKGQIPLMTVFQQNKSKIHPSWIFMYTILAQLDQEGS